MVLKAEGWLSEFQKWHKRAARKHCREVQKWQKPEIDWVKCNFNKAWSRNGLRGGFGVIVRNHMGGISCEPLRVLCEMTPIGFPCRVDCFFEMQFYWLKTIVMFGWRINLRGRF